MIQGNGGFMAADLTAYGRGHAEDAIKQAIVSPDTPLAPASRVVDVQTKSRSETVWPDTPREQLHD